MLTVHFFPAVYIIVLLSNISFIGLESLFPYLCSVDTKNIYVPILWLSSCCLYLLYSFLKSSGKTIYIIKEVIRFRIPYM